jgi:hypothetical protein
MIQWIDAVRAERQMVFHWSRNLDQGRLLTSSGDVQLELDFDVFTSGRCNGICEDKQFGPRSLSWRHELSGTASR